MDSGTAGWIAIAIAVLVYIDLLVVELRRAIREGKRIANRLAAYGQLPIFSLIAASEHDAERLSSAFEQVPVLLERAQIALETIRHPRSARVSRRRVAPNSSPGVASGRD